ncbi:LiaF transmembrane domain-containing protein [Flaviaesturariibacter terrae]
MDHNDFEMKVKGAANRMEYRFQRRMQRRGRGQRWTGLFLLLVGGLLLARQAGVFFPTWFFSWPVLLIGIGLWIGARHRFRGLFWLIPIAIGALNLLGDFPELRWLRPYAGPAALILIGLAFLLRPRRPHHWDETGMAVPPAVPRNDEPAPTASEYEGIADRSDSLDVTAVFGGVKKNVLSKNFRGGDIVTFMGGAEINLTQADFNQRIKIDCTNIFGGTKLILPPDWEVQSDIVAIFGGVDDKRPPATSPAAGKLIVLDGTCLFGGVEIRSFY